jgi:hypothetical protein
MIARAVAGIGGLIALPASLYGSLFVLLIALFAVETPDPSIADGDPCCGHPDTWGEVAEGIGWGLGAALVDALMFTSAVALLSYAGRGRWPSLPVLAAIAASGVLMTAGLIGYALAWELWSGPGV